MYVITVTCVEVNVNQVHLQMVITLHLVSGSLKPSDMFYSPNWYI